jgi:hypothetical protein
MYDENYFIITHVGISPFLGIANSHYLGQAEGGKAANSFISAADFAGEILLWKCSFEKSAFFVYPFWE